MTSFAARLMPLVQKLRGSKKRYSSVQLTAARIAQRGHGPVEPPALKGVTVTRSEHAGWPVFTVAPGSEGPVSTGSTHSGGSEGPVSTSSTLSGGSEGPVSTSSTLSAGSTRGGGRTAVYFHGGSFVYEISRQHWTLVAELVRASGATISIPIYPLAPTATASALVPIAADLAAGVDVIMGDSAGGDIALAAAMVLRDRDRDRDRATTSYPDSPPPAVILISPVLDVGLTDPRVAELEPNDPWLAIAGAKYANDLYRGELATTDPLVSPIYGSLDGLGPITLFSGTRDMLNADAARLVALATSAGHELEYHEAPGMMHVYPLLPIAEAKPARAVMVRVLRGD